jgi:hypothetical protein
MSKQEDTSNIDRKLQKGDRVTLIGLKSDNGEKYNGQHGTIVNLYKNEKKPSSKKMDHEEHYGVQIDGVLKPWKLKRSNLLLLCTTEQEKNEVLAQEQILQVGDRVVLYGLKTDKYNGLYGTIIALADPLNEGRFGVRLDKGRESLCIRPANIHKLNANPSLPATSKKSTNQLKLERDKMDEIVNGNSEDSTDVDMMAMMRQMTSMFLSKQQQIQIFGREIDPMPDYRAEVMQAGGFPVGVDHKWAHDRLRIRYEHSSTLPHMMELQFKHPNYEPEGKDILRRLRTNDLVKLCWYFDSSRPGSIYKNHKANPYSTCVRHNYSNQAYRKEKLSQGRTHVAVGFVDLGILMAADLQDGDSPLRFIGVDQSSFAVAKTLVIWELLKHTPDSSQERDQHLVGIMQVWFSSTWTAYTQTAVRAALATLCSSGARYHPEVNSILEHWLSAPTMSLKKARKEYAATITDAWSKIGMMKLKNDRIAMARYELTGDFGVGIHPFCGSIIAYDCPDGIPPCDINGSVFGALSFADIMDVALRNPSKTMIDAAEEVALSGIKKLASWCKSGKVVVELICSPFEKVIEEIASHRPWTMSWSNLVDYVDYEYFHKCARQCSKHGDTVHFAYSMNWSTIVSGVCLSDYAGEKLTDFRCSIINEANRATEQSYVCLGWDRRIRLPLPHNPINTVSLVLELSHYQVWVDFFFGKAKKQGPCHVANVEHTMGSPLSSTGNSTVAFTWTYDPEIHFHGVA